MTGRLIISLTAGIPLTYKFVLHLGVAWAVLCTFERAVRVGIEDTFSRLKSVLFFFYYDQYFISPITNFI